MQNNCDSYENDYELFWNIITTSNTGVVRASYQHAKRTSTLNKSHKFTISSDGYGGVFEFDKSVKYYYDAMNGVKLSL